MSQLVGVVLGLTVLLAIVGAIGTWVVGSVLYYTPGQMERGQHVLRRGADASFLALCVASVIYAVAQGRNFTVGGSWCDTGDGVGGLRSPVDVEAFSQQADLTACTTSWLHERQHGKSPAR